MISTDKNGERLSLRHVSGANVDVIPGTGSPEGAVAASPGSLYSRLDSVPAFYVKQTGNGNTGWVPFPIPAPWTPYTATITPSAGSWTASSQDCAFEQYGKTVRVRILLVGTPSGTPENIVISLPVAAVGLQCLAAVVDTANGVSGNAEVSGSSVTLRRYDGGNFASVIQNLYVCGVYEAS